MLLRTGALLRVGRDHQDNEITLDDNAVSRHHAVISAVTGHFEICDVGSSNGTFVNGRRVKQMVLTSGDHVKFGQTEFTFQGAEQNDLLEQNQWATSSGGDKVRVEVGNDRTT